MPASGAPVTAARNSARERRRATVLTLPPTRRSTLRYRTSRTKMLVFPQRLATGSIAVLSMLVSVEVETAMVLGSGGMFSH
jgi:hypothetical protein